MLTSRGQGLSRLRSLSFPPSHALRNSQPLFFVFLSQRLSYARRSKGQGYANKHASSPILLTPSSNAKLGKRELSENAQMRRREPSANTVKLFSSGSCLS